MSGPDPRSLQEPSSGSDVDRILAQIRQLERDLDGAFERVRAELRLRIEHNKVIFEEQVLKRHRAMKIRLRDYVRGARPMVVITAPVIYALIVPMLLLDLCVSIYHAVCFPVYGIAKVRRQDYIVFDRQSLAYLNALEKLNCGYCSYVNGLFAYVREVAARTEQYWCPIKHARKLVAPHAHYADFAPYGDPEAYRQQLDELRLKISQVDASSDAR